MKNTSTILLIAVLLSVGASLGADASTLVSYVAPTNANPAPTDPALPPTITDTSTTEASDLTLGSGLVYTTQFGFGGDYQKALPGTVADAQLNNLYFAFSITPTAGNAVTLSDIDFSTATMFSFDGPDTGFTTWTLESSLDNFSSVANSFTVTNGFYGAGQDLSLSSSTFSNLTGTTEFRLYVSSPGSDGSSGLYPLSHGNFTVNGTITSTVPEPGSFALLGLGFAALIFTMRSRRPSKV